MTAAVTGATGFLGRALLPRLVAEGGEVRALVRAPGDAERIGQLGATPVRGDLASPAGCAALVRRGDVVYHAAARVDLTGAWPDFVADTVETTRHLLAAALPQRPSRFVYISSAGVYVGSALAGPVSADRVSARPAAYNYYGRAKLLAEELVRAECERAGCPWTILRLGFLYGPGNRPLLRRIVPLLQRRRLFIIGRGDNQIAALYIDDAVDAIVAAGRHPAAAGRIYDVASPEPVTQRQFWDGVADVLGLPRCRRHVPYAVARVTAEISELWARVRGTTPAVTRAMVALMVAQQLVDAGAIGRELGWRPRVSFAEGLRRWRAAEPVELSAPEACPAPAGAAPRATAMTPGRGMP
jgi:nucleoside-diphosphate-sugar epimerase